VARAQCADRRRIAFTIVEDRCEGISVHQAALTVWDDAACERIHGLTAKLLADTGVDMKHEPARESCAAAGASVDGRRVRFPAALIEQALATAPRSWILHPRGGDSTPLELASGNTYFGTGPDCLYVCDPDSGVRRRARLDDVTRAAAVTERLPNLDFAMSMGLPEDVANEVVDVAQFGAMLKGTRKPLVVSSPFGGASLYAMRDMAAACGEAGSFACLAMSSPPLMLGDVACDKAIACADLEVPLVLAASVSAGSGGPASLTACVTVANAEVLAGLVVHQLARPGAPFVFGVGTGVLNMASCVDVYNAPGVFLANQAHLDLVRWYGLPSWSYAGHSDSKLLDEQWSLELGIATVLGTLSRATLLHDVGYLESGLLSALESIVLGDEVAGYARALLNAVPVDDEAVALAEIAAAGPGGNHLGSKMTRAHHRDFWRPALIDQNTHDRWLAHDGRTLLERVRNRLRELLEAGPAFTLDPITTSRLDDLASQPRKEYG
jgi:trimethylamine--corrinoid protein Co-methyltransferase